MNLVYLPATEPGDATYGVVPPEIPGHPRVSVHAVSFPKLVWYNPVVREQAIAQIRDMKLTDIVLVGFSKSGLGAWNIACAIPDLVSGTIIFDAPVARQTLPSWGTENFYADDAAWRADLPIANIERFKSAVPADHQLVLISGEGFGDEMRQLSRALVHADVRHTFLPRPRMQHHWNAGWLEQALGELRA